MQENIDKDSVWKDCLESIRVSVSSAIFSTWFAQTRLLDLQTKDQQNIAEIGTPSSFVKSTIENRYYGLIQDLLTKSLGKNTDLIFVVKNITEDRPIDIETSAPLFQNNVSDDIVRSKAIASGLRLNFSFEKFAVSSSNQMAWAAAEAISKNPGTAYNPLFIWGGVGVGKTHLMSAVGYDMLTKDQNSKVLLCTGEQFTNDIVEGIRKRSTDKFRQKYRKLNALLIDDIQFIAGKDAVQEEFFHTFNALVGSGSQIILTSDKPPSDISKLEERLRSRFEAGLIVDVGPPDFELRCAIIQIKSQEKGLDLNMGLVQLIASNIESARKIEGFLVQLNSMKNLQKIENWDEDMIKSMLGKGSEDISLKRKISPNDVINAVSDHYSVGKRALLGKSRQQTIALPRQILMYVLRTQLGIPLQEVGRLIGGRDHTTVMHAVNKITTLASNDVEIREDISGIKNKL